MLRPSEIFQWKTVSQADEKSVLTCEISAENPYFTGHFPGNPIFPGVGIVDATLVALEQLGHSVPKLVTSAKFLGPIFPSAQIQLVLTANKKDQWTIDWFVKKKRNGSRKKSRVDRARDFVKVDTFSFLV